MVLAIANGWDMIALSCNLSYAEAEAEDLGSLARYCLKIKFFKGLGM